MLLGFTQIKISPEGYQQNPLLYSMNYFSPFPHLSAVGNSQSFKAMFGLNHKRKTHEIASQLHITKFKPNFLF